MNSKPKLIDLEFLKKISNNINREATPTVSSKVGGYIKDSFINFIKNYSDLIIVIIILGVILYFRYKYINKEKEKINKIKPTILEVDYHRSNNYVDGKIIDTNDNIETSQKVDDDILNSIKDKITNFENELQPIDMTNLSSYQAF